MTPRSVLAFSLGLLFWASICVAQPESLYDSSDADLVWPPSGASLEAGNEAEWPGNGTPLGKLWPRKKVPVVKAEEEGLNAEKFFADYVHWRKPVVFDEELERMCSVPKASIQLRSKDLLYDARTVLSEIEVQYGKKDDRVKMSFSDFLRSEDFANQIYTYDSIPYLLKTHIGVPEFLRCTELLDHDAFSETRYSFHAYPKTYPMRQEMRHQLYCQIEGHREVLLVDPRDFIGVGDLKMTSDKAMKRKSADFNPASINFETDPQLAKIKKFYIAELKPGQCVYVPEGWLHQQNVLDGDHSLAFWWERFSGEDQLKCEKYVSPVMTWGDVTLPREGITEKPKEKTTDKRRNEYDQVVILLDRYFLKAEGPINMEKFKAMVAKDPTLLPDLPNFDDECTEYSEILFNHLDRNSDNELTLADVFSLVKEEADLDHWVGFTKDRMDDLFEISWDMRVDKAAGHMPPPSDFPVEEYIDSIQIADFEGSEQWRLQKEGKLTEEEKKSDADDKPKKDEL